MVPVAAVSDTRFFIVTLAGTGLTFSSNRNLAFVHPFGIVGNVNLIAMATRQLQPTVPIPLLLI